MYVGRIFTCTFCLYNFHKISYCPSSSGCDFSSRYPFIIFSLQNQFIYFKNKVLGRIGAFDIDGMQLFEIGLIDANWMHLFRVEIITHIELVH